MALAAGIAMSSPTASASTFQLSIQGPTVFGGNGSVAVTITDDDLRPAGIGTRAGGFAVKGDTNGDTIVENFTAWCIDISTYLNLPGWYEKTTSVAPLAAQQIANIKALFDTAFSGLTLSDNTQSGAFQLALWEIVNEDSGTFNVSSGTFKATGAYSAFACQRFAWQSGRSNQ